MAIPRVDEDNKNKAQKVDSSYEPIQAMLHILINKLRWGWEKSNEYHIKG